MDTLSMFSRFFKKWSDAPWLDSPCAPHLWSLALERVSDPLDADALWDDATGDGPEIVEARSQETHRRLREALNTHRRRINERLPNGKIIEKGQVFTDVVLTIAETAWRNELKLGATRLEMLVHNLAHRHQEDFQDVLPGDRQVRYVVMYDTALTVDQVRCHFGYGIYLPEPDEAPEAMIFLFGEHGAPAEPLSPWVFFKDGRRIEQPVGLYPDQDALILSGQGPVRPANWFSDPGGYVLLRRDRSSGVWTGFGDDRFTTFEGQQPATRSHGPLYLFGSRSAIDDPTLRLELQPVPVSTASEAAAGATLMPGAGAGPAPLAYALWLEAIVLQTVGRGIRGWVLWLDEAGQPADGSKLARHRDTLPALGFDGRQLGFRAAGEQSFKPIEELPATLSLPQQTLTLALSPLPGQHLALLYLPTPRRLSLDGDELVLGRYDPATGPSAQADIVLDQLDQPGGLRQATPSPGGYLGSLGLSRRHLRLCLHSDGMQLSLYSDSNPAVHLLDENNQLVATLQTLDDTAILHPKQALLVGSYLLRLTDAR